MALQQASQTYFNFTGGLNTEASPLTIPPTDALVMDNVNINTGGDVSLRRGLDVFNEVTSKFGTVPRPATYTCLWRPTHNNETHNYLVHINYQGLYVYKFDTKLDLVSPTPVYSVEEWGLQLSPITFAIHQNDLYIFGNNTGFNRLFIDKNSGAIVFETLTAYARDPNGKRDDMVYNETLKDGSSAPTPAWTYICIKTHSNADATDEPLNGDTDPESDWRNYWEVFAKYKVGAASTGDTPTEYKAFSEEAKTYNSNIVEIKDAIASSSRIIGRRVIAPSVYDANPLHGNIVSGRAWVVYPGAPETVYYSQVITEPKHVTRFYSFADPNSPWDSEIVDSDGGKLEIPGAGMIKRILPFGNGIVAICTNGIWFIRGIDPGSPFSPLSYSIEQIFVGRLYGWYTACQAGDAIIFAGTDNIYSLVLQDGQFPVVTPIGDKVRTLWINLPEEQKQVARFVWDQIAKRLYILYNETNPTITQMEPTEIPFHIRYDRILIYDGIHQAWFRYTLKDSSDWSEIGLTELFTGFGNFVREAVVTDEAGAMVTDGSGATVTVGERIASTNKQYNVYLVALRLAQYAGSSYWHEWAFGQLESENLKDFSTSAYEQDYTANIAVAYNTFGDVKHKKLVPYATFFMKRIETGEDFDATGVPLYEGSLKFAYDWNFAKTSSSPYYGTLKQIYYPERNTTSYFDYRNPGDEVVVWRERLRGFGRAVGFRFQSEPGKDFTLYGWQIDVSSSRRMK